MLLLIVKLGRGHVPDFREASKAGFKAGVAITACLIIIGQCPSGKSALPQNSVFITPCSSPAKADLSPGLWCTAVLVVLKEYRIAAQAHPRAPEGDDFIDRGSYGMYRLWMHWSWTDWFQLIPCAWPNLLRHLSPRTFLSTDEGSYPHLNR